MFEDVQVFLLMLSHSFSQCRIGQCGGWLLKSGSQACTQALLFPFCKPALSAFAPLSGVRPLPPRTSRALAHVCALSSTHSSSFRAASYLNYPSRPGQLEHGIGGWDFESRSIRVQAHGPDKSRRKSRVTLAGTAQVQDEHDNRFGIYAHPSDADAQAAATRLLHALARTTTAGSGGAPRVSEVLLQEPASIVQQCAIYFGTEHHVELLRAGESRGRGLESELPKVLADLCSPRGLQQDVLLKAIGKKRKGLVILDATAGFGHDALRMAAGGHRVTALERDPVMHAFVCQGLQQLRGREAHLWQERVEEGGGSVEAELGEAGSYLSARAGRDAGGGELAALDVVYLDPMFPAGKRKSALPKRRMQWLRQYLDAHTLPPPPPLPSSLGTSGVEEEVEELIEAARKVAGRVVLKRADDGPVVGKPSSSFASSKIVRYDIYSGTGR